MSLQLLKPLLRGQAKINAQKTRCKRGHELVPNNLLNSIDGKRRCKKCNRMTTRKLRILLKPKNSLIEKFCLICDDELLITRGTPRTIKKYCHNCYIELNKIRTLKDYYKKKVAIQA